MKKAAFLAAWAFFALTNVTAQQKTEIVTGNGTLQKEKRDIGPYTSISVNGPFEVRLTYSDTGTITFEGDENILRIITAEVSDGTLRIGTANNQPVKPSRNNSIEIKVPYRQLSTIALKGSGSIYASRTICSTSLSLELEGSGSIRLSADADSLSAVVLGPGTITVNGMAGELSCAVGGSGTIAAHGLEAKNVKAVVSGCGDIKTNCTKKIIGRIAGNGTIAFAGEPADTDLKLSGDGRFSLLDE